MHELPTAVIENPPFHRRPWVRRLAGTILIVFGFIVGKKVWHLATRTEANKHLEARQHQARERLGHGLDALFEEQLDRDSKSLRFEAVFQTTGGLGSDYGHDYDCERGLQAAFDEVLGEELVELTRIDDDAPSLRLAAAAAPSEQTFQLPHSNTAFRGVTLAVDVTFVGKEFHLDVQPPERFEFSFTRFGVLDEISESQVRAGILEGACRELGYEIMEHTTRWKRPPPVARDVAKDCEDGLGCRHNAEQLEDTDPATAVEMYRRACDDNDEDACLRAAHVAMTLSGGRGDRVLAASLTLQMACRRDLVRACAAAGQLMMLPREAGKPAAAYQREEALPVFLRGCDLGDRGACEEAVALVKRTGFAEAAPLLTGAASVRSKRYGTIFALRWGQWTSIDSGQATIWVTKEPAKLPHGLIATRFERSELPRDVTIPENVDVVYAIASEGMGDRCQVCKPSGGGSSIYDMRSLDCVCWIRPKR